VREYKYLGSTVTEENNITIEIEQRILMTNWASYGLKKQWYGRQTICDLYMMLLRPMLSYGGESWPLTRKDENILWIFEGRILRRISGPIKENCIWRSRYNNELYKLYNEPNIVKVIRIGQLRWLGHLFEMQEQNPCRKLTLHKPEGIQRLGRPVIRWLEPDVKTMGIRNWSQKS
jgi:hypothetical protein